MWARKAGGSSRDESFAITALEQGGSVIAGEYRDTATFGDGESNETSSTVEVTDYPYDWPNDIFIARYTEEGRLVWMKAIRCDREAHANSVSAYEDGSVLVAGSFEGRLILGRREETQTVLPMEGGFFAKYNPDGSLSWARQAAVEDILDIAALSDGSFVITGYFYGTALLGPMEPDEVELESAGSSDIFVARYNTDGRIVWAERAGGAEQDQGLGIDVFDDGSILLTGAFRDTVVWGEGEADETSVSTQGDGTDTDIYVVKLKQDGSLAWAGSAGSYGHDQGYSVEALSDGSALVTGSFEYRAFFGMGDKKETYVDAKGEKDIFVARYDPEGVFQWVRTAGSIMDDEGLDISGFSNGKCVVSGYFSRKATFGRGEALETDLESDGFNDVFVAKYDMAGNLEWAKRAGGEGDDQGHGVAALDDGSSVVTGVFSGKAVFGPGEPEETELKIPYTLDSENIFIAGFSN